jgi:vesicle-associated membrane protein 7
LHRKEYERHRAFSFLNEIKKKFIVTYGLQVATAVKYAMEPAFSKVLASEMNRIELTSGADQISKVTEEISVVRNIMEQNIESLIRRGDGIQDVMSKTDTLKTSVRF